MKLRINVSGIAVSLLGSNTELVQYMLQAFKTTEIPMSALKKSLGISRVGMSTEIVNCTYLNIKLQEIAAELNITSEEDWERFLGVVEVYAKGDLERYQEISRIYLDKDIAFIKDMDQFLTSQGYTVSEMSQAYRDEVLCGYDFVKTVFGHIEFSGE